MLDDLLQQGLQNVEDARFVRDQFIPTAIAKERWNIAVYEAHRATELLLRGMICQVGFKPPEIHDISGHISFLLNRLPGERSAVIPFTIGAYVEGGEGYGIILGGTSENSVGLFRLDNGVLTQLGQTTMLEPPAMGQVNLKIELSPPEIAVYFDDSTVLVTTDSSYQGPFQVIDRSFIRQPDTEKIRHLKKFGVRLTRNRSSAYYGEKLYTKNEALHAISYMEKSFDIARAFFYFE